MQELDDMEIKKEIDEIIERIDAILQIVEDYNSSKKPVSIEATQPG
jgi:hypothetical protein